MLKGKAVPLSARNTLPMSLSIAAGALVLAGALWGFQKPFRQYHGVEYYDFETPADYQEPGEFVFARMMFPGGGPGIDGYSPRYQGDWRRACPSGRRITPAPTGTSRWPSSA